VEVAAGDNHTIARRSDGSVVAWGDDSLGQVTVPDPGSGSVYKAVDGGRSFSVALVGESGCATLQSFCVQSKATSVAGCTATLEIDDCSLAAGVWSSTHIPRDASAGVGTVLGIYIYTHGAGIGPSTFSIGVPFGTLCLQGFQRSSPACAPAVLSNAQPGVCNPGPMAIAVGCNGGALGIAVGEDVNVQLWYRDPKPGEPGNANFSDAVFYTVQ
jgi:hypothetical protein